MSIGMYEWFNHYVDKRGTSYKPGEWQLTQDAWSAGRTQLRPEIDALKKERDALREALRVRYYLNVCPICDHAMKAGVHTFHKEDCPHYATEAALESTKVRRAG